MKSSVLDSYAILCFLFKEKGFEKIIELFDWAADNNKKHFITALNWAEVRYIIERRFGNKKWFDIRNKLLRLPIEIIPVDIMIAETAAEIKTEHSMSLADCTAAALAKINKMLIYTGDPEFKVIEKEIKIEWL